MKFIRTLFTEPLNWFGTVAHGVALLMLLAVLAFPARAQQAVSIPFLNGFYLTIPAASTNTVASSISLASGFTNVFTYAKQYVVTNVPVTITNPANGLIINGYVSSNQLVYVTNNAGIVDVSSWINQDGSLPFIGCAVAYTSGSGTNTTVAPVFTLTAIADGLQPGNNVPGAPQVLDTAAGNTFVWTGPTLNGTNIVASSTNVNQNFLWGVHKVRITIANPTNGTNDWINILGIWFNGFKSPTGT
jgi:hypothetical protein